MEMGARPLTHRERQDMMYAINVMNEHMTAINLKCLTQLHVFCVFQSNLKFWTAM